MKKLFSILGFLFACVNLFASAKGFTSVHSGFGWWIGAIALSILIFIIGLFIQVGIYSALNDELCFFSIMMIILGLSFLVGGFIIYPTIWCGFLGAVAGALISLSCFYAFLVDKERDYLLPNLICIIVTIIVFIIYCVKSSGKNTVLITYAICISGALISNSVCLFIGYLNNTAGQRRERRTKRNYENQRKAILESQNKNNNYVDSRAECEEIDNLIKNISDDILQIEMMQNKEEIDLRCIGNLENHVIEVMKHKKNITSVAVKSLRVNKKVISTILKSSKKKLPVSSQVRIKGILQLLKL